MGYTGGKTENPTYRDLGDHTESIQIDFDPGKVSYEKLLDIFWQSHDPTRKSWSRQYRNALFYHNEEQKKLAIKTRDVLARKMKQEVYTEILPEEHFYLAEAYHQKHALRGHRDLLSVLKTLYEKEDAFVQSTVAARVNGFLGGFGTTASLKEELYHLPLPSEAIREILSILKKYDR